jgi:hypothetical protein
MAQTLNHLVESLHHSLLTTNSLLVRRHQANGPDDAPDFVVDAGTGDPALSIPATQFFTPNRLYLQRLQLDLPCYVIASREAPTTVHFYAPSFWQRLFYTCHLYRIRIRVRPGQARVRFFAEHPKSRIKPGGSGGQIQLTPEQAQHLLELPKTVAKPLTWPMLFILLARWWAAQRRRQRLLAR